ncbi:probable Vacuole morphology and inheritance protein 14 [Zygosaccharomyces bailii ISA1307]|nr:probable Vacuole morphology and inheritance protein 14 [Zygosaccharomyces bailii ISA1307]
MGLAAAAIALGTNNVGRYLNRILPPVLACFGDQNDQVRFYACESLYNIAKIAKGEILVFFNEVFDVLCKISADSENSVRGAAELLDRLIKDIVAERASSYVSVVNNGLEDVPPSVTADVITGNVYQNEYPQDNKLAFSLPNFIPLLTERIYAINPDTRVFLVDWLKVLLNTPGLELISFLPSFLGGLFTFLGDSHKDVRTVTHALLDLLLHEVDRITTLQAEIKKKQLEKQKVLEAKTDTPLKKLDGALIAEKKKTLMNALGKLTSDANQTSIENASQEELRKEIAEEQEELTELEHGSVFTRDGDEYVPGQDIRLDFPDIIDIVVNNLASSEAEIQLVALHWIKAILQLSPGDFVPLLSKILSLLLKLLSDPDSRISESAQYVNEKLVKLCNDYDHQKDPNVIAYGSIVNSLTLQFFDSRVDAKIACLDWLLLIYQKAPNQILEHNDSMFLTLLKSLSDEDDRLIEKALSLLSSLCSDSNDNYIRKFLQDFLTLLKRDCKLLKTRANFIMRQICARLSPERIYKEISPLLDPHDDIVFVRMMIQILSTNLLTASEVASLRKKLRNGDDGMFFNTLFKSWCYNPVSVISLCLVSENYELAYSVLQAYVNYELTLNDLVQLDVLVQLLESPVFTRLRLQLLEQQKYPFLHKSLYGILMILPQSKAFEILEKRLSSVNNWTWQPCSGNYLYKQRNSSSSSGLSGEAETSTRSISQSRLHHQELLDTFNKVCEEGCPALVYTDIYGSELPFLGSLPRGRKESRQSPVPARTNSTSSSRAHSTNDNDTDTSSVVFRSSATSGLTGRLSGKLKRLSGT